MVSTMNAMDEAAQARKAAINLDDPDFESAIPVTVAHEGRLDDGSLVLRLKGRKVRLVVQTSDGAYVVAINRASLEWLRTSLAEIDERAPRSH